MSNSSVLSVDSKETIDTIVCDNNLSSICNIGISEELKRQLNDNSSEFEYVLLGDSFKGKYSINDKFIRACFKSNYLPDKDYISTNVFVSKDPFGILGNFYN